jgi:hypothetical protein
MKYFCSECKNLVIVLPDEEPIKICNCEAPIVADVEVTVYSKSTINDK